MILANVFGQDSLQVTSFLDIDYSLRIITNRTPPSAWQNAYVNGLQSAEAVLAAQMAEVKMFWDDGDLNSRRQGLPSRICYLTILHLPSRLIFKDLSCLCPCTMALAS
jgi:hypothetical protein